MLRQVLTPPPRSQRLFTPEAEQTMSQWTRRAPHLYTPEQRTPQQEGSSNGSLTQEQVLAEVQKQVKFEMRVHEEERQLLAQENRQLKDMLERVLNEVQARGLEGAGRTDVGGISQGPQGSGHVGGCGGIPGGLPQPPDVIGGYPPVPNPAPDVHEPHDGAGGCSLGSQRGLGVSGSDPLGVRAGQEGMNPGLAGNGGGGANLPNEPGVTSVPRQQQTTATMPTGLPGVLPGNPLQDPLGVLMQGMTQLQTAMSQTLSLKTKDIEVVKPGLTELPRLQDLSKNSAIDFGDWLHGLQNHMGDLSNSSSQWWNEVLACLSRFYSAYLDASHVGKLVLKAEDYETSVLREERWTRVDKRASAMILASLPENVRAELLSSRVVGTLATLCRVLILYRPGSVAERQQILRALESPNTAATAADAVQELRRWARWVARATDIGIQCPDPSVMIKGLDLIVKKILSDHADISFRVSMLRYTLEVDTRPTLQGAKSLQQALLSELEQVAYSGRQGGTAAPVVKAIATGAPPSTAGKPDGAGGGETGSPTRQPQAKAKTPCKFYLSDKGCSRGASCTYSHDFTRKERMGRCWTCGSTQHRQADCPTKAGGGSPKAGAGAKATPAVKTVMEANAMSAASTGPASTTSSSSATGDVPAPAVPEAEIKNLLQEASAMLKEIRQLKTMSLTITQVQNQAVGVGCSPSTGRTGLLDSGASHPFREATEDELQDATQVTVQLAGGREAVLAQGKSGTLLTKKTKDECSSPIVPLGALVQDDARSLPSHRATAKALWMWDVKKKWAQHLSDFVGTGGRVPQLAAMSSEGSPFTQWTDLEKSLLTENVELTDKAGWSYMRAIPGSRQKRKRMLSLPWVIHLYSGPGKGLDPAFLELDDGKVLVQVDINRSKAEDMNMASGVYRALLWAAATGRVSGIFGSPPTKPELLQKMMWLAVVSKAARAVHGGQPVFVMIESQKVLKLAKYGGLDRWTSVSSTWEAFLEAACLEEVEDNLVTNMKMREPLPKATDDSLAWTCDFKRAVVEAIQQWEREPEALQVIKWMKKLDADREKFLEGFTDKELEMWRTHVFGYRKGASKSSTSNRMSHRVNLLNYDQSRMSHLENLLNYDQSRMSHRVNLLNYDQSHMSHRVNLLNYDQSRMSHLENLLNYDQSCVMYQLSPMVKKRMMMVQVLGLLRSTTVTQLMMVLTLWRKFLRGLSQEEFERIYNEVGVELVYDTIYVVRPLRTRTAVEVTAAAQELFLKLRAEGLHVSRVHADRARELRVEPLRRWLLEKGSLVTYTEGQAPQANGRAEAAVKWTKAAVKRLLASSGLGKENWAMAAGYAAQCQLERVLKHPTSTLPFGSKVHVRSKVYGTGGRYDLDSRWKAGCYVGPSLDVRGGHVVLLENVELDEYELLLPMPTRRLRTKAGARDLDPATVPGELSLKYDPEHPAEQYAMRLLSEELLTPDQCEVLALMLPSTTAAPSRFGPQSASQKVWSVGAFVHGGVAGVKTATAAFPASTRVFVKYVKQVQPDHQFNALAVTTDVGAQQHVDAHNVGMNLIAGLSYFKGGALEVEGPDGKKLLPLDGDHTHQLFDPRLKHSTKTWYGGSRVAVIAYSVRDSGKLMQNKVEYLEDFGFTWTPHLSRPRGEEEGARLNVLRVGLLEVAQERDVPEQPRDSPEQEGTGGALQQGDVPEQHRDSPEQEGTGGVVLDDQELDVRADPESELSRDGVDTSGPVLYLTEDIELLIGDLEDRAARLRDLLEEEEIMCEEYRRTSQATRGVLTDARDQICAFLEGVHEELVELERVRSTTCLKAAKISTASSSSDQIDYEEMLSSMEGDLKIVHTVPVEQVKRNLTKWVEAIRKEVNALIESGTLRRISLAEARQLEKESRVTFAPAKCVFTLKPPQEAGKQARRKCRVVICGNHVRDNLEFGDLYASGTSSDALRVSLVIAALRCWLGAVSDITGAFLLANWPPDLPKYGIYPPRVVKDSGVTEAEAWIVERPLYGLRESPRIWSLYRNERLRRARIKVGEMIVILRPTVAEPELWMILCEVTGTMHGLIVLYVDDIAYFSTKEVIVAIHDFITQEWPASPLEWISGEAPVRYLGVEIRREPRTTEDGRASWVYTIGQGAYVQDLLREHNMMEVQPTSLPAPKEWIDEAESCDDVEGEYEEATLKLAQKHVGECLWLATKTRPDIMFVTTHAASLVSKRPSYVIRLSKRVLAYLAGTVDLRMTMGPVNEEDALELVAFTDASYAPYGRRSFGAAVITLAGAPVAWKSGRQSFMTLSVMEAELYAATQGCTLLKSVQALVAELFPTALTCVLAVDNTSAAAMLAGGGGAKTPYCAPHAWVDAAGRLVYEDAVKATTTPENPSLSKKVAQGEEAGAGVPVRISCCKERDFNYNNGSGSYEFGEEEKYQDEKPLLYSDSPYDSAYNKGFHPSEDDEHYKDPEYSSRSRPTAKPAGATSKLISGTGEAFYPTAVAEIYQAGRKRRTLSCVQGVKGDLAERLVHKLVASDVTSKQFRYVLYLWRLKSLNFKCKLRWEDINSKCRVSMWISAWKDA
ncbi:RE1 [Symbiodinium necroappetens]|uniref:RE1 protein n=1 Tax=Symbiodinium necroappetens TaxID=1628268 RepID=A0A812XTD8_9DINO|nr:RE1 [Symbiodinium necroappetens]